MSIRPGGAASRKSRPVSAERRSNNAPTKNPLADEGQRTEYTGSGKGDDDDPSLAGRTSSFGGRRRRSVNNRRVSLDGDSPKLDEPEDDEDEDPLDAALRENAESFNPCRKGVYLFVSNKWFDRAILVCIAINCVGMAVYDPLDGEDEGTRNQVLAKLEYVLLAIFSSEMLLKWVAFGIPGYFSVNWNILDCVVVVVAWAALIPGVANFSALRLLKAFRPLRTMGKSGGMRKIIDVMLLAMRSLIDVFFLCCLVFFIFGIVGIQLFQGTMTQHCFSNDVNQTLYVPDDDSGFRACGGRYGCPDGYSCMVGKSSQYAAQGLSEAGNPNGGVTSFDDIGHAFLSIFVAITLEGWVDVMYLVQDSYSDPISAIYFVLMVLLGSLFVLNLALAVVADEYDAQGDDEEDEVDSDEENDKAFSALDNADSNICTRVAVSNWFNSLVFVFIMFNTFTLSCEHVRTRPVCPGSAFTQNGYTGRAGDDGSCVSQAIEMDTDFSDALEYINYIFIGVFTIELIVKVIGLGPRLYVADRFNIFDATIVVFSYVELAFTGEGSLSVLRAFRLGRVFKMAKSWDSLRAVIETIAETLPSIGYLSILLFLFMFIASVAGMQLFGGQMESTRSHYDNFGIAMLTTFQILSGENWNEVLYDAVNSTSYAAIVYFLLVVVIGNFLVLNLFLAILLSKFSTGEPPDISIDAMITCFKNCLGANSSQVTPEDEVQEEEDTLEQRLEQQFGQLRMSGATATKRLSLAAMYQDESKRQLEEERRKDEAGWLGPNDPDTPLVCTGDSLFCLSPTNCLRVFLGKMIDCPLFQNSVLFCIFVSSLLLAADEPGLDQDSDFAHFLKMTDWVFTIVFTLELIIKVIVYGLMFTPDAYLKDGWNVLDTFIVAVSLWSLFSGGAGGAFKALRALRALKPLRTIKRAPGLKIVVDAIMACMPSFLNIGCVSVLFYLVFAIIGVQFWKGKFWTCNDSSVDNVSQCVGYYTDDAGDSALREWSNAAMNFDNVGNAMLTLFEVASLELWLDVMYSAMDVPTSLGDQPELNESAYFAIYFVFFVVFGSFLVMNLFVGAVVDNFTQAKADDEETDDLSQEQLDFMDSLEMILQEKPYPKPSMPEGTDTVASIRRTCFKICMWDRFSPYYTGTSFDILISTLIVLNIVVMSMYVWEPPGTLLPYDSDIATDSQESSYNDALEIANYAFTWIFFVEMVIKLIGLGAYQYIRDDWNKLDAFVVIISVVSFIVNQTIASVVTINPSIIRTVRAFRVIRVFRLLKGKYGRGVLALLETLVQSLPALANVSALLMLVLFIYACLGMSFFGDIETSACDTCDQYNAMPYKMYNEHCNFKTFYRSFLLLFRMSTGESWNGIMHDVMDVYVLAWAYFVTYMVIVAYLLFNLLVAVVLEQFSLKMHQQQLLVNPTHICAFVEHWRRFDPNCTHLIKVEDLPVLMQALEPPLGFSPGQSRVAVFRDALYVPNHHGQVHFVELFTALLKFAYGTEEMDALARNSRLTSLAMEIGGEFPTLIDVYDDGGFAEAYAATRLQAMLHGSLWREQPEDGLIEDDGGDGISKVSNFLSSKLQASPSFNDANPTEKQDEAPSPQSQKDALPPISAAEVPKSSSDLAKEPFPPPPALDEGYEAGSAPPAPEGDPNEPSLEDSESPPQIVDEKLKEDSEAPPNPPVI